MSAAVIVLQLIAQYGPTAARGIYSIYETWKDGKMPTAADWDAIEALAAKPLVDPGSAPLLK